ncbi:hypothetical protein AB0G02_34295 [Actinosynnema sp. NPDC023658]|uniref:hypothetical protein n=1 Tax=Actinosynnema sp. NPDC023658 TaxID=3155465 RepID=UPI0033ED8BDF
MPRLAGDGPIVGDPSLLRRAGEHFGVLAGVFESILANYDYLHRPPVKTSVADALETSTGKTFIPPYMEITDAVMAAVRGLSRSLQLTQDKLVDLAQSQEDAEETNTRYARNAVVVPPRQNPGPPLRKGTTAQGADQWGAVTPARSGPIRKGVVPGREAADQRVRSDIGIPLSPQVLVNALGERIGVLAPLGSEVPGEGGRVFLTGPDGRLKGFFQPDDEHTLDEVVPGVLQPGFAPSREEEPVEPLPSTPSVSFPAERVDGPGSPVEPSLDEPVFFDSVSFPAERVDGPDSLLRPLPDESAPVEPITFTGQPQIDPDLVLEPPVTEPLRADSIAFPAQPGVGFDAPFEPLPDVSVEGVPVSYPVRPVDDLGEPLPVEVLPDGTELYAPVRATPTESLETPPVVVTPEGRDPNES